MGETVEAAGVNQGKPALTAPSLPRVIAVDGSAASGKSTVGRRLAAHLGYPFLDTGSMYRAITVAAIQGALDLAAEEALASLARSVRLDVGLPPQGSNAAATITVDGRDVTQALRSPEVEEAVSLVARVAGVRKALVQKQREIAASREIVMAGRDIGTVVLPKADLKIYLDASLSERAARRHKEFASLGRHVSREDVMQDIRRRDRIDTERAVSPLRPADDAVIIETDGLSLDQVMERVLRLVHA